MADDSKKYLKLITSEYAKKPKYNAYVKAFLDMLSPVVDCYDSFNTLFILDTAVGDQLDKLGALIGIDRQLPTDDSRIPKSLPDDIYRMVIKAKMYKNHWDGTREGMDNIMKSFFPNLPYEIVDGQDMSITVTIIDPTVQDVFLGLIEGGFILPKPAGVRVSYVVQENAIFGWDSDTAFIDGWDKGQWANT